MAIKKQPTPPKGYKPKKGYTTKDSIEYERMSDRQQALAMTITPKNYHSVNYKMSNRADSMAKNAYGARLNKSIKTTASKPTKKLK